jgi:SAM-dependent methyltransferase
VNKAAACRLAASTRDFYTAHAASFSATRERPWDGWVRVVAATRELALGGMAGTSGVARKCLGGAAVSAACAGTGAAGSVEPLKTPAHAHCNFAATGKDGVGARGELTVLDVAAGNLRFERYVAGALPQVAVRAACVDACAPLVKAGASAAPLPVNLDVTFAQVDVLGALFEGELGAVLAGAAAGAQLTVCFGFLHHVPGATNRENLLVDLLKATAPGGLVAVSFWEFEKDPRLAHLAHATTPAALAALGLTSADLDAGDWLLGWQGQASPARYCHAFAAGSPAAGTPSEARTLCEAACTRAHAQVVEEFCADGKTGDLNRYVLLKKDAAR